MVDFFYYDFNILKFTLDLLCFCPDCDRFDQLLQLFCIFVKNLVCAVFAMFQFLIASFIISL